MQRVSRLALSYARIAYLRSQRKTWREIGETLAKEQNRSVAYQAGSIQAAYTKPSRDARKALRS